MMSAAPRFLHRAYICALAISLGFCPSCLFAQSGVFSDSLLPRVRAAARNVRGAAPQSLHYLTFTEVTTPIGDNVQEGSSEPVAAAFTVFQVRYANGWIMVDAGMVPDVEAQFLGNDTTRHSYPLRSAQVRLALREADLIVLSHEHWDHAAGVERGTFLSQIVSKTLLTRQQWQTLVAPPQSAYLQLPPDSTRAYRILDYEVLHPLAPGVVLIRAPGHTPGSQLVYVRLDSGREALLIGDVVWLMEGILENRQKPDSVSQGLAEDRAAIQEQIDWLRRVMTDDHIALVPSHDSRWLALLETQRILIPDLDLTKR